MIITGVGADIAATTIIYCIAVYQIERDVWALLKNV